MAAEPKRRVKSIKKPGDNPIPKKRKPKGKRYSRAYISKLLKKVLKKKVNMNDPVHLMYKTYRQLVKVACLMAARENKEISMKMARMAMDKLVPRDMAMCTIMKFRQGAGVPKKESRLKQSLQSPCGA